MPSNAPRPAGPDVSRICHILPRNTNFSAQGATSIDLFVSEIAQHSRSDTLIIGAAKGELLQARQFIALPEFGFDQSRRQLQFIAATIKGRAFKSVIVQQHSPSALRIRQAASAPVILQRHNFIKAMPEGKFLGKLFKANRTKAYNKLGGIFFVSEILMRHFERDWPDVQVPRAVIYNGIDPKAWQPAPDRRNDILVVGRAVPDKGILEAASAIAVVLARHPGWTATFVLSEAKGDPDYYAKVTAALAPVRQQVKMHENQPFSVVKGLCETSAIAVIASKWQEPFGRTCLEAHAGGAAVVSSGTGGLREISGETAVYVDPNGLASISCGLELLVEDTGKRASLARLGRARVEAKFSLESIAHKMDMECEAIASKFYSAAARQTVKI